MSHASAPALGRGMEDAPPLTTGAAGRLALTVFIVFFGEAPQWLPLTLQSMAANRAVSFVVIGDTKPPAVTPSNVHFEHISFEGMQRRLSLLLTPNNASSVRYDAHYKANDIKPLAPVLYPHLLGDAEWWAWADLDVVFGDLLAHMRLAVRKPACCKVPLRRDGTPVSKSRVNVYKHRNACRCSGGEAVGMICPLFPNPWSKKAWGPFTAFRTSLGTDLFRRSPHWKGVIASAEYAHFDEWWGPFHYTRGWETMGDVITRLAYGSGEVILSRAKLPFAEAKSCRDGDCMFCPCGAIRFRLDGASLRVNDREVMMLHLAESKYAWQHVDMGSLGLPAWAPQPAGGGAHTPASRFWAGCVEVDGLGWLNRSCAASCTSRAPIWDPGRGESIAHATRLGRHRVTTNWAGHIKYTSAATPHAQDGQTRLRVGACQVAS